jgi:hypothetical protein
MDKGRHLRLVRSETDKLSSDWEGCLSHHFYCYGVRKGQGQSNGINCHQSELIKRDQIWIKLKDRQDYRSNAEQPQALF